MGNGRRPSLPVVLTFVGSVDNAGPYPQIGARPQTGLPPLRRL